MAKTLLAMCLLLSVTFAVKAQVSNYQAPAINPFIGLSFNNSYKDTVTIKAVYTGESRGVNDNDLMTLKQLNKLYGINVSKLENAMGINLSGYPGKLFAPYRKSNSAAIASKRPNSLVLLKCTVYRFFTFDGIASFFYVDKVL